jgi:hypothetical protein
MTQPAVFGWTTIVQLYCHFISIQYCMLLFRRKTAIYLVSQLLFLSDLIVYIDIYYILILADFLECNMKQDGQ